MYIKTLKITLLILFIGSLIGTSCKKDKDIIEAPQPEENESEVMTTMKLIFTDSANATNTITTIFRDPDGDGGAAPDIFDTIKLAKEITYFASLILLNETANPVDTISNEVKEEGKDHLFCFTPSGVTIEITKTDSDGTYPIGLESKWKTGSNAESGTVKVVLKHQPGIKNSSCDPGETDAEVTFYCRIVN